MLDIATRARSNHASTLKQTYPSGLLSDQPSTCEVIEFNVRHSNKKGVANNHVENEGCSLNQGLIRYGLGQTQKQDKRCKKWMADDAKQDGETRRSEGKRTQRMNMKYVIRRSDKTTRQPH